MLTVQALEQFGANVREGMARCMNNEAFYLRLVGMALADANFDRLRDSLAAGDAKAAFEAAHALKGSIGNLSLTPIYEPISAITEKLRGSETPGDLGDLPDRVWQKLAEIRNLQG